MQGVVVELRLPFELRSLVGSSCTPGKRIPRDGMLFTGRGGCVAFILGQALSIVQEKLEHCASRRAVLLLFLYELKRCQLEVLSHKCVDVARWCLTDVNIRIQNTCAHVARLLLLTINNYSWLRHTVHGPEVRTTRQAARMRFLAAQYAACLTTFSPSRVIRVIVLLVSNCHAAVRCAYDNEVLQRGKVWRIGKILAELDAIVQKVFNLGTGRSSSKHVYTEYTYAISEATT